MQVLGVPIRPGTWPVLATEGVRCQSRLSPGARTWHPLESEHGSSRLGTGALLKQLIWARIGHCQTGSDAWRYATPAVPAVAPRHPPIHVS
jgi:hypothetical protein